MERFGVLSAPSPSAEQGLGDEVMEKLHPRCSQRKNQHQQAARRLSQSGQGLKPPTPVLVFQGVSLLPQGVIL